MRGASEGGPHTILGLPVRVAFLRYSGPPDPAAEAYRSLPGECRDETIIAALPGDPVSLCEALVAYLHALDSKHRGSRVRSLSMLFIMGLLGYRQARDVVENIESADYLVVASDSDACFQEALSLASRVAGGEGEVSVEDCDHERLSERVESSIRVGALSF